MPTEDRLDGRGVFVHALDPFLREILFDVVCDDVVIRTVVMDGKVDLGEWHIESRSEFIVEEKAARDGLIVSGGMFWKRFVLPSRSSRVDANHIPP